MRRTRARGLRSQSPFLPWKTSASGSNTHTSSASSHTLLDPRSLDSRSRHRPSRDRYDGRARRRKIRLFVLNLGCDSRARYNFPSCHALQSEFCFSSKIAFVVKDIESPMLSCPDSLSRPSDFVDVSLHRETTSLSRARRRETSPKITREQVAHSPRSDFARHGNRLDGGFDSWTGRRYVGSISTSAAPSQV